MLTLIHGPREVAEVQSRLTARIKKAWTQRENRKVVWRPDNAQLFVQHNGEIWFTSRKLSDSSTHRYWNCFGRYKAKGTLNIAVEINIPTKSETSRVAGFFGRDERGNTYLFHDGSVGGGAKGVSRGHFLRHIGKPLVKVMSQSGSVRVGVLVAAIDEETCVRTLKEFVNAVIEFKAAVKRGEFSTKAAAKEGDRFESYYDEYSGSKTRKALGEIDYITRHGDVVRAIRRWRELDPKGVEKELKDPYVDWAVRKGNRLIELYEVKTSCDRQALYTAIGQLAVHDAIGKGCRKILAVPEKEVMPEDIRRALRRMKIETMRFLLLKRSVRISISPRIE